jgi:hypothetical protein
MVGFGDPEASGAAIRFREVIERTVAAYNAHDFESLRSLCAPDFLGFDHRPVGLGQYDFDQWIAYLDGLFAQVGTHHAAAVLVETRGNAGIFRTSETAETLAGSEFSYQNVWVAVIAAERVRLVHVFTAEAEAEAHALFEQLAATSTDPRQS